MITTPHQLRRMNMDALTTHLANVYSAVIEAKNSQERNTLFQEAERTKNAINRLRMEVYA